MKVGLLVAAMALASGNLLRTRHRLGDPHAGSGAARLLRNLVSGEAVLVVAAIFAAAVLSSLPPPSKALASVSNASAHVGPGPVAETVTKSGYRLTCRGRAESGCSPELVRVSITKGGKPVRHADVLLSFAMLDMEMQNQEYRLSETRPGIYSRAAPALVMVGHWGLSFQVAPKGGSRSPCSSSIGRTDERSAPPGRGAPCPGVRCVGCRRRGSPVAVRRWLGR